MSKIILDIGQNHCGDMKLARKLIDEAILADYVKFQLYDHKKLYHGMEIPNVELNFSQAYDLVDYGGDRVFFSVFDEERVDWCISLGVRRFKIAYSMRNNAKLIDKIVQTGAELFISADEPIGWHTLYCIPKYPANAVEVNYDMIKKCDGFSDHTLGTRVMRWCIENKISYIEKHFAIDHETGVDALWSITPEELRRLLNAQ